MFISRSGPWRAAVLSVLLVGLALTVVAGAPGASADNTTVSYDTLRTGWDPNEPGLAPASVSAADFGQLFATQLDGQIYAQPIVAKGVVLAVTENDQTYGLNPVSGAVIWSRNVGPYWPASAIGCGDLVPNIGATATPVYDPTTGTAYFTAKVNDGTDVNHPHWYVHAIDITTGAERAGFPTSIAGSPTNDPTNAFNPKTAMQRPGLLLLDGVVYAGFASHCDYGPYVGYVVGVNATTGRQSTMWSTEAGSANSGAGIWQSGGGLVSDGAGRIILTTGNGVSPPPGPGNQPPGTLAESVVRLAVNADGSLSATDFFSPVNNTNLDTNDTDLGSGGPMALPTGFGTAAYPNLLVQAGKDGRVFLLDRDNLGGVGQGPGGTDAALQTAGPYNGVWGHPGFWGGDGGYVYTVGNAGRLTAFKVGVSGSGLPALTATGTSTSLWGYTSGSPVVTSTGSTSGSALVWAIWAGGPTGSGGQLRAYDAVPANGVLTLRYSAPIGTASKFAVPATDGGRVFLGTRDGRLYGFGRPSTVALSGSPTDFGSVAVGTTASRSVTVTATQAVTVSAVSALAPFGTGAVNLPTTLAAGQTLTVPTTFTPGSAGAVAGSLTFTTSLGTLAFDLHGTGTRDGLAAAPASLAFGQVPISGKITLSVSITNTGTSATTITGASGPAAPFSAGSLPTTGAVIAPGASVSVPISFAPTTAGAATSQLTISSSTGGVTVPITGTGVAGAPQLTISPVDLNFGTVTVGTTATASFDVSNTGNVLLTITKAAPPAAPFTVTNPIAEGQQLAQGDVIHQTVSLTPTAVGPITGSYLITGNDNQGAHTVTVHGIGAARTSVSAIPAPSAGGWQANGVAQQVGANTVLTPATPHVAGDVVYGTAVVAAGLHARFTAQLSGGTGADGLSFALLDATKTTASSLGLNGGALGYGSLPGVAVTLDTFKNVADPSNNFIGIATGATNARDGSLVYAATAAAPTSLRSGTHTVDVSVTATTVSVSLDGGAPLTATVAVPPRALVAFTAGNGGQTDVHTVSSVAITQQIPVGAITGIGGKCVDVKGGLTADGTPVQLFTCNGTAAQIWSVPANQTLRALNKCLDLTNAGTANATPVRLFTCSSSVSQLWIPQPNGSLLNPYSHRCLDDKSAFTVDANPLQIYDCNGTAAQRWTLPTA